MNWDAIGAVGEVAAALAVIITLIYLSRQIRNAATESRLAAIHDVSTSYTSWIQSVAASEQLSDIWDRGLTDFSSLSKIEKTRFLLMMSSVLRIMDDAHGQYTSGRMDYADWRVYESVIELAAGSSGIAAYFADRDGVHTEAFAILIHEKMAAAEPMLESMYRGVGR